MLPRHEFSSAKLPAHLSHRERFNLFRDGHFADVATVEIDTSDMPFHATLEASLIGSVTYAKLSGTINRVKRTPYGVRTGTPDRYLLVMNLGSSTISGSYRDNSVALATGAAFIDGTDVQDFHGGLTNNWVSLALPRKLMDDAFPRFEDSQGSLIQSSNEALTLLRNYLAMIDGMAAMPGLAPASLTDHITSTLTDLVGLATGAKGGDSELAGFRGLKAGRLQAVLDLIRKNYRNPALSAQLVGVQLGLSARYVQDLLAQTGQSFSERLLELRLQDAKAILTNPRVLDRRIGDVALEVGFGDISYFNRCFKKRFGCTPNASR